MLGNFQKSHLRIELEASESQIRESLLSLDKLNQWLLFGQLSSGLPEKLHSGLTFTTKLGLVSIEHYVKVANDNCLELLLSQAIDGYHQWYWGDGWVQSSIEGISLLPLNLGQTLSLLRLRQFLNLATDSDKRSRF